jgi:hypothetical protein
MREGGSVTIERPVNGGERRRGRWGKRVRIALVVLVASNHLSCETIEKVLPYAIVAGGAIASVVAFNYLSDCSNSWAVCEDPDGIKGNGDEIRDVGYTEQVLLMIGTVTTVAGAAADYWAEHQEKQRELAKLQDAEKKVDDDYAQLSGNGPPPQAVNAWGQASPAPAPPPGPERWGMAPGSMPTQGWGQQPGSAPGYPPQGGYPLNRARIPRSNTRRRGVMRVSPIRRRRATRPSRVIRRRATRRSRIPHSRAIRRRKAGIRRSRSPVRIRSSSTRRIRGVTTCRRARARRRWRSRRR